MFFHDALGHVEAEASATFALGGEKRLKDALLIGWQDSVARVGDTDSQPAGFALSGEAKDPQLGLAHRIGGILEEVYKRLHEPPSIQPDLWQATLDVELNLDIQPMEIRLHETQRLVDE